MFCIVTGMAGMCSKVATTRPRGPATRPHNTARKGYDTVCPHAGDCGAPAPPAWLARESRYKNCIVAEGATVVSQYGASGLRYNAATWQRSVATRPAIRPGTRNMARSVRAAWI